MTSGVVEELLRLLDEAFAGDDWHSLLGNLRNIAPVEWTWLPPGGDRSLRDMVQHIGSCKLIYDDHAFGGATLDWDDPLVKGEAVLADPASALPWLRDCHDRLRRSVAALDDAELARPRRTNWGELKETRWIIAIMLQHDLYHAGEINHLRSLYGGDDRWAFDREAQSRP
jgi:hypothetical protein